MRSFEFLKNACNRNEPRDVNIASEQIERNLDVSWDRAFSPGQDITEDEVFMKRKGNAAFLPMMMMADLTLASWETITRRMLLISQNKCSQAEYARMVSEKTQAAMDSSLKLLSTNGQASVASLMAPWLSRASANAKRLRKKK